MYPLHAPLATWPATKALKSDSCREPFELPITKVNRFWHPVPSGEQPLPPLRPVYSVFWKRPKPSSCLAPCSDAPPTPEVQLAPKLKQSRNNPIPENLAQTIGQIDLILRQPWDDKTQR